MYDGECRDIYHFGTTVSVMHCVDVSSWNLLFVVVLLW